MKKKIVKSSKFIIVIMGVMIMGLLFSGCGERKNMYKMANELYQDAMYGEALRIFESLGKYKDSVELAERCRVEMDASHYMAPVYVLCMGNKRGERVPGLVTLTGNWVDGYEMAYTINNDSEETISVGSDYELFFKTGDEYVLMPKTDDESETYTDDILPGESINRYVSLSRETLEEGDYKFVLDGKYILEFDLGGEWTE